MFNVNEKIVYPMHGAGVIEEIEKKEILGEVKEYYILRLPVKEMKVMIPVENSEALGLRYCVDEQTISEVLELLESSSTKMPKNWNRRFRKNNEKLKTGEIIEVATVVRDLMIRDLKKGLSTSERKMLKNAKKMLISEIAIVKNVDAEEIEKHIDKVIDINVDDE